MARFTVIPLLILAMAGWGGANENCPQFRGVDGQGIARGKNLPVEWSTTKNVAWKAIIPGEGWSSPIVWKDKIFVTTFVSEDEITAPRPGYYAPRQTKKPKKECQWLVLCLNAKDGKVIWQKTAHKGPAEYTVHVKGSYASETPVTDGERVYAYFGNVGIYCFDMNGNKVWSKRTEVHPTVSGWGTGSSPTLYKDRLYILNDNRKESYLAALDKTNGKEIWRVKRKEKGSWATPYIWETKDRTEIVTVAPGKARSYDLEGNLLWELRGMSSICVPSPVTAHGLLYINSGYEFGGFRPVYAVRPGAKGDISLRGEDKSNKFIAWYHPRAGSYHPSTLAYGDYVYVLYSRGYLACFDARTGKEVYKEQRLKGNFTASPWAHDGKIYCQSEDGVGYVVQAGPKFKILGKSSLKEMSLATPAIAGDQLLIRTRSKLYSISNVK